MTAVTTMAVEREMNADKVMKHAFSFFAVCSPGLLRLDILTNYVLNVDKEQDKDSDPRFMSIDNGSMGK